MLSLKKYYRLLKIIFVAVIFCNCSELSTKKENVIVKKDSINKGPADTSDHAPIIDLANEKFSKEKLKPIVEIFSNINATKNWTAIKEADLNLSTEGGDAVYYYKEGALKKVVVKIYGETGKLIKEYYLNKDKLAFVFEKEYKYNRPLYYDSSKMKEFNDTAVFDINKSEITEDRSYFENGIMIHQSNNQDCGSPFEENYLMEEQKRIQSEFDELPLIH